MTWAVRYHFKVSTPINSPENELSLAIGGRDAFITGERNKALDESYWLTLNIGDLESEGAARDFGKLAVSAVNLAGVRLDVGIDPGENRATTSFGRAVVEAAASRGINMLPNVHGLLVYEEKGNEYFGGVSGTGTVRVQPGPLLSEIASAFDQGTNLGENEQTALTLIALSKIAREPLAEAVLCISAVEFLSTDAPWTAAQRELLKNLRHEASDSNALPKHEADEVASSLQPIFKGVLQSIRRRMLALGFDEANWESFREVYKLRSDIFHGTIIGRDKHVELATRARQICASIVLAAANRA
jgi:hypothetical protein